MGELRDGKCRIRRSLLENDGLPSTDTSYRAHCELQTCRQKERVADQPKQEHAFRAVVRSDFWVTDLKKSVFRLLVSLSQSSFFEAKP